MDGKSKNVAMRGNEVADHAGCGGTLEASFLDVLVARATATPRAAAFVFLKDDSVDAQWSYADLSERARAIAATLQATARPGDRALLIFPPGLDFAAAFVACVHAGLCAVPVFPARSRAEHVARLESIASDSGATLILSTGAHLDRAAGPFQASAVLSRLSCVRVDEVALQLANSWVRPQLRRDDLVFLQYTSGSTGTPKGVMVTHRALLRNQELMRRHFVHDASSIFVSWLPLYHDMGLIGNVLHSLYVGAKCYLMSPASFVQEPGRWLRAISKYRATSSFAPNFAYELCVDRVGEQHKHELDLSSWTMALNGAEPVRCGTIERFSAAFAQCGFRRTAFFPAYGLAEATLFVSGGARGNGAVVVEVDSSSLHAGTLRLAEATDRTTLKLVSSGVVPDDSDIRIVDPRSRETCEPGRVGEIWLRDESVTSGYWRRQEATDETFGARIAGSGDGPFLRTGDLGIVHEGQLFVTGRSKDLIIFLGRNHYPQDIEETVRACSGLSLGGAVAAVAIDRDDRQTLAIVAEIPRSKARSNHIEAMLTEIRERVALVHALAADVIVLVKERSLPLTSSGKIQRFLVRERLLTGELAEVARRTWDAAVPEQDDLLPLDTELDPEQQRCAITALVCSRIRRAADDSTAPIDIDRSLASLGVDSLGFMRLQLEVCAALKTSTDEASWIDLTVRQFVERAIERAKCVVNVSNSEEDHAQKESRLSYNQEALWMHQQLHPQSNAYNVASVIAVSECIAEEVLERAVDALLQRHELLRTTFIATEHGVQKRTVDVVSGVAECIDATGWDDSSLRQRIELVMARPFDLERGPLLRAVAFFLGARGCLLAVVVHHIVADMQAYALLLTELLALCRSDRAFEVAQTEPASYARFVRSQHRELASQRGAAARAFWKAQLAGELPVLALPHTGVRPQRQGFSGDLCEIVLSEADTRRLRSCSRDQHCTVFCLLVTGYLLLLHKYTQQSDLIVGVPASQRKQVEGAASFGHFANLLPLRSRLESKATLREFLRDVRDRLAQVWLHRDYPYQALVREFVQVRDAALPPLVQSLLVSYDEIELGQLAAVLLGHAGASCEVSGYQVQSTQYRLCSSQMDLSVFAYPAGDGLVIRFEYDTDLFEHASVARMAAHYRGLLNAIVDRPAARVAQLSLLTPDERETIVNRWNDTSVDYREPRHVQNMFEAWAAVAPHRPAVIFEDAVETYSEINARANALAHALALRGIGPEECVAICLPRSSALVVSILAVLKAGAAYVPIDTEFPRQRIEFVLRDCQARVLISSGEVAVALDQSLVPVLRVDDPLVFDRAVVSNPCIRTYDHGSAYVIYTSGSTGQPKGAVNTHSALRNRLLWMQQQLPLGEADRVLQKTPCTFDVSVWELLWPLMVGSTLVVARPGGHRDPGYLAGLMQSQRVSTVHFVPPMLQAFLQGVAVADRPMSLRQIVCSGEELSEPLAADCLRAYPDAALYNLYGPTEAAIDVSYWRCEPGDSAVPIGRPIANVSLYVLDAEMEPVPVGVTGELHIGGAGLARGYLGRADLTASRFVPDPHGARAGARLYRTGDLARYRSDGQIEYLGRADFQVKVRGFRIELEEIEACLLEHPRVLQSVVVVRGESAADRRLVGYALPREGASIDEDELLSHVRSRLPAYMVPSRLVVLDSLPLTANGKIDRAELPAPGFISTQSHCEPLPGTQTLLALQWQTLLEVPSVSRDDNFFALGGHSLLAMRLVSSVRASLGVELAVREVFEAQSLQGLSQRIDELRASAGGVRRAQWLQVRPAGSRAVTSYAQQRLWFLDQLAGGSQHYTMPAALRIEGELDRAALEVSVQALVDRHEALRTCFEEVAGEPQPRVIEGLSVPVVFDDLRGACDIPEQLQVLLRTEASSAFDLSAGPLVRCRLIALSDRDQVLLLVMHHMVSDGWSIELLLRELWLLYEARRAGEAAVLAPLPVQYADYAYWQRRWLEEGRLEDQLHYWRTQLQGLEPLLELPTDRPRAAVQRFEGSQRTWSLSPEQQQAVTQLCQHYSVTPFVVLLSVLQVLLWRYSGRRDVAVGSPVANRGWAGSESLVGLFVNTVVLRTEVSSASSFQSLLGTVRHTVLEAQAHQEVPFERVVDALNPVRSLSYTPLFQVMLLVQETPLHAGAVRDAQLSLVNVPTGTAKFDLTFSYLRDEQGGWQGGIEYSTALFEPTTIQRLWSHAMQLLVSAAADPTCAVGRLPMLTTEERVQLLSQGAARSEVNTTACLHELFERQVEHTPQATALVSGTESLSYAQLNDRANVLARRLIGLNIGPEQRVGVCLERNAELVIALLGVLKAGAAYVPLDPSYPQARLAQILTDATPQVVLTQRSVRERFAPTLWGAASQVVAIDEQLQASRATDRAVQAGRAAVQPANLAYLIYTSGSTGRPKGVAITHANVVAMLEWAQGSFDADVLSGTLASTSICFDLSVFELFLPLSVGGTVLLVRDALSLPSLKSSPPVRLINTVPSAMEALLKVQGVPSSVQVVNLAGEPLSRTLVDQLYATGHIESVFNLYGPSEDTTYSTCARLDAADRSKPTIGRAITGSQAYVLDSSLEPVPIGVPGELYLGGAGVARGYYHQADQSAARFVPDPCSGSIASRLYRTGDRVRWLSNGELEFLGRLDRQTKLRGFRIELGEIEQALVEHADVREAAVELRPNTLGERQLIGYVVWRDAGDVGALRRWMQQRLPDYLVPGRFTVLAQLPLTANGKIDRAKLPAPSDADLPEVDYIAPQADTEQRLARIWADVLGLERISVHHNFFEIGGHSLLLSVLRARVASIFGVEPALTDFFQYPTLRSFADHLDTLLTRSTCAKVEKTAVPRSQSSAPTQPSGRIAVIGMAGRFPKAADIDEYWRNLAAGIECATELTDDDLLAAGVTPEQWQQPGYVRRAFVLEQAESFDAHFFDLTPRDAELTDPQHRVLLECAQHTFDNAGYVPQDYHGAVGVYVGVGSPQYLLNNLHPNHALRQSVGELSVVLGNDKTFAATRLSYKLNLQGPSVCVDTACSTSLVAIHEACRALLAADCDLALAGGANVNVPQESGYLFQPGSISSPDGRCRTFDADAKGTVKGSGVGTVLLKRYEDAQAEGDFIHAVILGSAINNDGAHKVGFTATGPRSQAAVIRTAQQRAGVPADSIGYVEAHGTATPLGDPIEITALTQAFRETSDQVGFCAVSSVKPNVGHLDAAAGVAGFIKAVECLKRGQIPPHPHFSRANPEIDFAASPFFVPTALTAWPAAQTRRRAAVSSFGLGGTNAHLILEQADTPAYASGREVQLLTISAASAWSLQQHRSRIADQLESDGARFPDIVYSLNCGRRALKHRDFIVAGTRDEMIRALRRCDAAMARDEQRKPAVCFMFPGQGTHYPAMAFELYRGENEFRAVFDECADYVRAAIGVDLRNVIRPDGQLAHCMTRPSVLQPLLVSVQLGIWRTLKAWGIEPDVMIGHSIGEYTAATVAGVWSVAEVLRVVVERGRLTERVPEGSMLGIAAREDEVESLLRQPQHASCDLAAVNAPSSCVVAGPNAAIAAFEVAAESKGWRPRRLPVTHAFHSRMLGAMADDYRAVLLGSTLSPPTRRYVSSLTGTWISAHQATDADYWVRQMLAPVRFNDGVATLRRERWDVLVEVGPGNSLSKLVRMSGGCALAEIVPTFDQPGAEQASLFGAVGRLWRAGVSMDWQRFYAHERRHRVPTPGYPFERQRYWIAPPQLQPANAFKAADELVANPLTAGSVLKSGEVDAAIEPGGVLKSIWGQLLGVAAIDADDDFFALGGDSVLASQMIVQVKRLTGVALPVDAVFRAPTLAQLSSLFAASQHSEQLQEFELQ